MRDEQFTPQLGLDRGIKDNAKSRAESLAIIIGKPS
jgi:hypothetical protein